MKIILLALIVCLCPWASAEQSSQIYTDKPGERWIEGTPMGNGTMGAMLLGGVARETIYLNEDTLWSGEPLGGEVVP